MEISEFLAARLGEDECVAQAAARTDDGHLGDWIPMHFGAGGFDARVDDHIARYDPARALREVEAKRAILAEHAAETDGHCFVCSVCITIRDRWKEDWPLDKWPCRTILIVAAAWSDYPDYDPEWAVSD